MKSSAVIQTCTHTHTDTPSHTQTGHFPGALHDNIHQQEQGHNGLDYWLRGAESPTCDGGNSWMQRRAGRLGNQLLAGEQWDDSTLRPSSVSTPQQWTSKILPIPLACHLSHVSRDFNHHALHRYCRVENYSSSTGKNTPVSQSRQVAVSWPVILGKEGEKQRKKNTSEMAVPALCL